MKAIFYRTLVNVCHVYNYNKIICRHCAMCNVQFVYIYSICTIVVCDAKFNYMLLNENSN